MKKEKFEIGDLLLISLKCNDTIVKIDDIDLDDTQHTYNFECLYGIYSQADSWVSNKEYNIIKKVDESFVDKFFEDRNLHKIGSKVYFDGEEDFIKSYDRNGDEYYLENYDDWVSSSDIEIELVNESTFKVGDLVKIKNEGNSILKVVEIYSLTNILIELIIGEVGDEGSYESSDLELTTQEELNRFQQGYLFKIGDEVLYDDEIDIIKSIDINDDEQTYLLLNADDWVAEYDISPFTESEKSDEVVKVVESPKVEPDKVEPTIKTTKKRILLGAC